MSLNDRALGASQKARDELFKSNILALLERIALALEGQNQPVFVEHEPSDIPDSLKQYETRHIDHAEVCTCGGDPTTTCGACSASRLAWAYTWRKENENRSS